MNIKPIILLAFTLSLFACHRNFVHNVVGPDGSSNWASLHCKVPATCWRFASEVCPYGYVVKFGDIEHTKDALIKCKGRSHQLCGGDWETHNCQGNTHWVEDRLACEPC